MIYAYGLKKAKWNGCWAVMKRFAAWQGGSLDNCQSASIETAQWLEDRLVNIPSSVRFNIQGGPHA
jgi:hypothetical protein